MRHDRPVHDEVLILYATMPLADSLLAAAPEFILEGKFTHHVSLTYVDDSIAAWSRLEAVPAPCSAATWHIDRPRPVRCVMLIEGRIHDWSAYRHYLSGLEAGRLLEHHDARPLFFGPPTEVLRGTDRTDDVTVAIDFTSLNAVRNFWGSDAYAQVRARRSGAADLNVGVWCGRR